MEKAHVNASCQHGGEDDLKNRPDNQHALVLEKLQRGSFQKSFVPGQILPRPGSHIDVKRGDEVEDSAST